MKNFDNTNCTLIDLAKISKELSAQKGEPLKVDAFGALLFNGSDFGVLHTEIVLKPMQMAENGTIKFCLPVFTDNPGTIAIFPKYDVWFDLDELQYKYAAGVSTIAEYCKERRGYNSRLQQNEAAITQWLNA